MVSSGRLDELCVWGSKSKSGQELHCFVIYEITSVLPVTRTPIVGLPSGRAFLAVFRLHGKHFKTLRPIILTSLK